MAKTIKLIEGEIFSSKRVLIEVLSLPPQGCNIADMRKRMRVMDAIEAAPFDKSSGVGELTLEDADYDLLRGVFHANQFRLVHKDLLAIADSLDDR
jgi:hypothetical protein